MTDTGPAAAWRHWFILCAAAILAAGCSAPTTPPIGAWHVQTAADGTPAPRVEARPVLASLAPLAAMPRTNAPPTERERPPAGYKIGAPYTVNGITYVPAADPSYDAVGRASWYGEGFHGKPTASGETYDQDALVAAHPTLPMPSYVLVTNLRNGRTVMLRVNNRGPYKPGRILDVSRKAAQMLGFAGQGLTEVRVRFAGLAPLDGSSERERAHLAQQPWYRALAAQRTADLAPR